MNDRKKYGPNRKEYAHATILQRSCETLGLRPILNLYSSRRKLIAFVCMLTLSE